MRGAEILKWLQAIQDSEYDRIPIYRSRKRDRTDVDEATWPNKRIKSTGIGAAQGLRTPPRPQHKAASTNSKRLGRENSQSNSRTEIPLNTSTLDQQHASSQATDYEELDETTPRADRISPLGRGRLNRQISWDGFSVTSLSDVDSRMSSHASSALKKRREMEANPSGVRFVPSGDVSCGQDSPFPAGLRAVLAEFRAVDSGAIPVVSMSPKTEILEAKRLWGEYMPDTAFFSERAGDGGSSRHDRWEMQESPGLVEVRQLLNTASKYHERGWDEAGWITSVHFPLLRMAIPDDRLVEVAPCTTAGIIAEHLPGNERGGKKVDFCLTIDPRWPRARFYNTPASVAINKISSNLPPDRSINHTGFPPLAEYPIVVSIETKRPGGSNDTAELQLGVWQRAQLDLLGKLESQRLGTEPVPSTEGFDFLPAIHIVGHNWRFAAMTKGRDDQHAILWTGCPMGSTETILGIYRIVWCLRRLERFATERYWPWFQRQVLGLPPLAETDL